MTLVVVETAGDALGGLGNGNGGIFTGTLLTDRGRRPKGELRNLRLLRGADNAGDAVHRMTARTTSAVLEQCIFEKFNEIVTKVNGGRDGLA